MGINRVIGAIVCGVLLVVCLLFVGRIVENVSAGDYVVVQAPWSGKLTWYTTPGIKWQGFGSVTTYKRRDTYEARDARLQFNDGGHATIIASMQYDMPSDVVNLNALHTRYGSPTAIKEQVIQKVVDKVLYMTGPLMSSRESYAEKRTDLIHYVQDQVDKGVYKVETTATEATDPLTGQRKSTVVAAVALDTASQPVRQETSVVAEFGIRAFNFAIQSIKYDDTVERQIQQQQQIIMDVQTAVAEARKAEQRRITSEQQGQANAATAKWEQETIKAKAIVVAEQNRDVAKLSADAAEQYRREQLLRAEADSTYKRQVMAADGALAQKLQTMKDINQMWATAFMNQKNPMVPQVVMGSAGGANAVSSAQSLVDMLLVKTARDLNVDPAPRGDK